MFEQWRRGLRRLRARQRAGQSVEDPRYARRWEAFRTYCALGIFGLPLLLLGTVTAFYDPEFFGSLQGKAPIILPIALIACAALTYLRVVRLRCPRCEGRFFAGGPWRFPDLLVRRCHCCGLRMGVLNGADR